MSPPVRPEQDPYAQLGQSAADPYGHLGVSGGGDPYAALGAVPQAKPSLLSRVGAAVKSFVPTAEDQLRYGSGASAFVGPVSRLATGMAKQTGQDVKTLALGGLGDFLKPGDAVQAPSLSATAGAGLRVGLTAGGAGLAGRGAGALASRVLPEAVAAPLARVATGAATGAAFTPSDPAVGAIVGGGLGAAPEVGNLPEATRPLRRRIAETIDPSVSADLRAAQVHPLTGLPNAVALGKALPSVEADPGQAVAHLDINGFKNAQDAHPGGHLFGDQLIQRAGATVAQAAQDNGVRVFHPHGDEFVLAGPADRVAAARDAAEAAYGSPTHEGGYRTSISGGVGGTAAEAEQAMYVRKAQQKAQQAIGARIGGPPVATATLPAPSTTDAPTASEASAEPTADDLQYRFGGPGVLPQTAENIADIQRSALTSPFSKATREYPRVAEKANQVGAARHYANWLATRGVQYANEGLTPEQVGQFYNRLVVDNLEAVNPESPALAFHRAQYPAGVENEPWFKTALDNYQTNIESKIEPYAEQSGVAQAQMRRPSLGAYVKLLAVDPETGAPYSGAGGSVPKNLSPRVLKTVSAQQATGSALQYSVDPQAIVQSQAEKIVKGARNQLIDVAKETGRPLEGKELPMPGEGIIVREHSRPVQTADGETVSVLTRQKYAVPKSVADAVAHVQKQLATGATTPYAQAKLPRLMTGASLEFSPAAAPYHMASLTAKVGKVPGTGVLDELPNALPILGQRAQGIARVVGGVDFSEPADRAMEARLAKIGALRPSDAERKTLLSRVPGVGRVTQGLHDLLFGPQGVDVRTRIWLGKRFVAEHPGATDDQIRKFVTDLAGNYVRENSGDLVNGLQDLGATAYARFAVPSIKTGITQNIGISGLGNRPSLVARQLVRGAAGTLVGIELLNRALSGHGPESNNAGHRFDIDVTPEANAARRALGQPAGNKPVYAKLSALDPGLSRAMRATGLDALGNGGSGADAARQMFNTDALGLLSPAARFATTAFSGYQPYIARGGPIPAAQPVAPGQSQLMANLRGAAAGTAGTMEAAFGGGGSPQSQPFGKVSTAMNLMFPQLFTSGSGLSPAEAQARDRYFQMKDYRAAQRRNARQRAAQ